MKPLLLIAVCLLACCPAVLSAGEQTASPTKPATEKRRRQPSRAETEHKAFLVTSMQAQKWNPSMKPPTSYLEAGLLPDAKLIHKGSYLDGGTRGYLFKDSAGTTLAVCTGPGLESKDLPGRIDAPRGSRYFVGTLHYRDAGAQMLEPGSAAETFIRRLLNEATEPVGHSFSRKYPEVGAAGTTLR